MIKILLVLIAVSVAAAAYFIGSRPQPTLTQSVTAGEIDVTAEYLGNFKFEMALNTHSVDLSSFDFSKSVMLQTKNSELKTVSVTPVSDSPPHHRTFILIFPKFSLPVTLIVKDLGGITERKLVFERR